MVLMHISYVQRRGKMSLIPSAAAQIMVRNVVKITRNVLKKYLVPFK